MKIVRKIKPFHTDERGELSHLLADEKPITSAVLITSKKGSIRANHYHKKDTHHVYMLKGEMEYTYKNAVNKKSKKRTIIVKAGEVVTSPPLTMHAMKFLEYSICFALTTEPRSSKQYENDTIRVKLIE